jgi:two-component system, NtrC family, nitrogen regulation sensor histidine kinase NtrY
MFLWLKRLWDDQSLPVDEVRRRRREALLIAVTAVLFTIFAVFETRLPEFSNSSSQSGNVIFFLLINLNLILLVLLIFLVTRNLVKLIFERRRGILGSRLRTKLVLAFLSLSIVPTLLLFLIADGFLGNAIESWFGQRVGNAIEGSVEVAHRYYQRTGDDALHFADELGRQIVRERLLSQDRRENLRDFVIAKRNEFNADAVVVYAGHERIASSRHEEMIDGLKLSAAELDAMVEQGLNQTITVPVRSGDVVRGGIPLRTPAGERGAVFVAYLVPRAVSKAARRTTRSQQEFRALSVLKRPLRNGYTITFLLVTLVVLFSGTWFGFYFAKGITIPIQRLGEGMREVAQGNWDYRAEVGGDEEVATLVGSFNVMAGELKSIHSALEERRRYIENILENITAGVLSVDAGGMIATVNPAAAAMLGMTSSEVVGRAWADVSRLAELRPVVELVSRLQTDWREKVEQQVKMARGTRSLTVWITATRLTDEDGVPLGFILFFEDVTHLLRVERMEAWREVARRIAHEIKNPLTPIQLSAQRLRKRYAGRLADRDEELLDECTRTIIGQVEQLKRLVNEFSTFARLPATEVAPCDLNELAEEALVLFREGHPDVQFSLSRDLGLPLIDVDRDAIKRVLVNLLDNAVGACLTTVGAGEVEIVIRYDRQVGAVRLEVADDGRGMAPEVKARAFEPYFSTKKDGTGLGLAIVSAIAADHHAYVRLYDNEPQGTRVVIEFPMRGAIPQHVVARA